MRNSTKADNDDREDAPWVDPDETEAPKRGKSKASAIEELDTFEYSAEFTMTITGPLKTMQPCVDELRKALKHIKGVQIQTVVNEC
jgi:hypothetical protein